jgi:hypothetical protein
LAVELATNPQSRQVRKRMRQSPAGSNDLAGIDSNIFAGIVSLHERDHQNGGNGIYG